MTADVNSEAYIAGALLIDGQSVIQAIQGIVSRDDFHVDAYGAIFTAALSLASDNEAIDPVSIRKRAGRDGVELSTELMMDLMEKEGVRFMNVQDVDKKRRGSILSTVVMIVLMGAMIALFVWAQMVDPIPFPIIGILIAMPAAVIIGVLIALKQRMKQIEGGEEDAARKY